MSLYVIYTTFHVTRNPAPSYLLLLLFLSEIPEFLSDEECVRIISLAKDSGLQTSTSGYFKYDGDLEEDLAIAGEVASKFFISGMQLVVLFMSFKSQLVSF